jgi:TolA-binding protein
MENLYEDLDRISDEIQFNSLTSKIKDLEGEVSNLKEANKELNQQIITILEEKNRIELNLTAVYQTAIKELERKDRQNEELLNKFKKRKL